MKFWMKVHCAYGEYLVAACDEELLGKEIEEEDVRIYISPRFYGGELVDEERLKEELKRATSGNLIGKKCVELAIKLGLVDPKGVKYIGKIPHAIFVIYFEQGI